jgi:phage baseplate assembly protein W
MKGISVKLPLSVDNIDGIYTLNKTLIETIKQNFKMLLLTNPGERIMSPQYGIGVKSFLFEQNTVFNEEALITRINEQVEKYMTFINIIDIIVEDMETNELEISSNAVNIKIEYSVPLLNYQDTLLLDLNSN